MNHYISLSLTNRKTSFHLHALYSPRTALRTFTPRTDQLVICRHYLIMLPNVMVEWSTHLLRIWAVPASNLGPKAGYPEDFRGFPQSV
jgi:hypothetical protein